MSKSLIEKWLRPELLALNAYHVPDPGNMVKLDAMENPYSWPEGMIKEWQELLAHIPVNRYPDPTSEQLTTQLRQTFQIEDKLGILLGNGSDELIQMLAMAVAEQERVILSPQPGFVMYQLIATWTGMQYVGVPLQAGDFSLDMPAMLAAIKEYQPALIFLAYPNNPTGNLFERDQVDEIIQCAPGLVIIDEAYTAFTTDSYLSDVSRYHHVLVMRTVSKMGLAGLRLGYLVGASDLIDELNKIRLPYNINVLTQQTAQFALQHQSVFDEQTNLIVEQRTRLHESLSQIDAVQVYPSEANFILFRVSDAAAVPLFEHIKSCGVLIKTLHAAGGVLTGCLRVTVGTAVENEKFIHAVRAFFEK